MRTLRENLVAVVVVLIWAGVAALADADLRVRAVALPHVRAA